MSATGDRDLPQEGQEGLASLAGDHAEAAEADSEVGRHLSSEGGEVAPAAGEAGFAGPEGGPGEEAEERVEGEQEEIVAGSEEDSDIGPADEEEYLAAAARGMDVVVDARRFPMAGFRWMFLDLVHSLLHRIYYNDHILVRPHRGRMIVRHETPAAANSAELPVLQVPELPRVRPAFNLGEGDVPSLPSVAAIQDLEDTVVAQVSEEAKDGATAAAKPAEEATGGAVEEAAESAAQDAAGEAAEGAAGPEEVTEWDEGAVSEEEKAEKEENEKNIEEQKEGPENDADPGDGKSSCISHSNSIFPMW